MVIALTDAIFGRAPSLPKFHALETLARVMYQAWADVGRWALVRAPLEPRRRRVLVELVERSQRQEATESKHLLWIGELCLQFGVELSSTNRFAVRILVPLLHRAAMIAHTLAPAWLYQINAELEAHACAEYARFLSAHPELESAPSPVGLAASVADLLRMTIADELEHRRESIDDGPRYARTLKER